MTSHSKGELISFSRYIKLFRIFFIFIFTTPYNSFYIVYVAKECTSLLDFLTGKLRQPLEDILPGLFTVDEALDGVTDFIFTGADLFCGVSVTESEGVVLHGLEIGGDTEGSSKFVVSRVAFADTRGRVVYTVGDTETTQLES